MAGSKSVQKKGGSSRGGGVKTLGGHDGSGGRSTAGRSNGGFEGPSTRGNLTISPPSGLQNRSTTDNRGKGIATASRDKGMSSSSRDTQTPGRKGANSSHESNVSTRVSPPSHGTPHSTGNESHSRTLPLQYPASSNRVQPLPTLRRTNLNMNIQPRQQLQVQNHVQEEEEDDAGDAEEQDDDDIEPDDIEPEEQDGDDLDAVNGEDVDYDQLLADVMADPARQSLPLLSEQPHPVRDTIWFDRDDGLLTREIAGIFRRKFDGPWYSWTATPIGKQERYFRTFASKFNWDAGITQIVKSHFDAIATKRMRGIVSQVRTKRKRPTWIGEKLWARMCLFWATPQAQKKSATASASRNSDRNGRGPHRHRSGQSSYLTIQRAMEDELQRPVSWAEVFLKTHTNPDGSFIDQKAKEVAESYEKCLQDALDEPVEDGEYSDLTSQRNLTIEEKNNLFLKCTEFDPKGTPYGVGQLSMKVNKGKRKISYGECSSTSPDMLEVQEELKRARQMIADQAAKDKLRDDENARLAAELKASQVRMTELEQKVDAFLKTNQPPVVTNPSRETPAPTALPPAPTGTPQDTSP